MQICVCFAPTPSWTKQFTGMELSTDLQSDRIASEDLTLTIRFSVVSNYNKSTLNHISLNYTSYLHRSHTTMSLMYTYSAPVFPKFHLLISEILLSCNPDRCANISQGNRACHWEMANYLRIGISHLYAHASGIWGFPEHVKCNRDHQRVCTNFGYRWRYGMGMS